MTDVLKKSELLTILPETILQCLEILISKGAPGEGILDVTLTSTICPVDDETYICTANIELVQRADGIFVFDNAHYRRSHYAWSEKENKEVLVNEWNDDQPLTQS